MESERQRAKQAIQKRSAEEPAFDVVLEDAERFKLELQRETNRHKETMRASELGWVGRFLGAEGNAAQVIALFVVMFSFFCTLLCLVAAYRTAEKDFWGRKAEGCAALAVTALSYIFGRSGRPAR